MHAATAVDRLWFQAHPDREYRLRPQTDDELMGWWLPPSPDVDPWCIVRRDDGATEVFARNLSDAWADHDPVLEEAFDTLRKGPSC